MARIAVTPRSVPKIAARTGVYETPWEPGPRGNRGAGLTITYGWHNISRMGEVLIAATPRGICFLGFTVDGKRTRAENRLHDYFPSADIAKDANATAGYAAGIESQYQPNRVLSSRKRPPYTPPLQGGDGGGVIRDLHQEQELKKIPDRPSGVRDDNPSPLPLDLYGTPFQLSVWRALLTIPFGETVSYQNIAQAIGRDTASRAVGGAVGDNPVSILVPCHRVIQSNGEITNYGWGTPKKRVLLTMEGTAA